MLVLLDDFSSSSLGHENGLVGLLILVKAFLVHDLKHFFSCSSAAVQGAHGLYNEFENITHVFFALDDQVDIPVANVYRYALPTQEWRDLHLFLSLGIEMFSEHPESTIAPSKSDALDSVYLHSTTAWVRDEIWILIMLLRGEELLIKFPLVKYIELFLSLLLKFKIIGLQNIFSMIDRLAIGHT